MLTLEGFCFGSFSGRNKKHTKLIQKVEPQIKTFFDKNRQHLTSMSLFHTVNSRYQSCFGHSIKKALYFIITMFYIYLVLDLLGYRLADALLLFFFARVYIILFQMQSLHLPLGRTAFFPRLGSNCGALCKGRQNLSPCSYWPKCDHRCNVAQSSPYM